MKDKTCPQCNTPMIIDEWAGWIWRCFHCDHEGPKATNEEIKEYENTMSTLYENSFYMTPDDALKTPK